MAFLDDFASAVSGYPAASVELSIVDLAVQPPGIGPSVTVNEVWAFQVRVKNKGKLNMTGVTLKIEGQNGAQVGTSASGPWASSKAAGPMPVNGNGGQQDTVNLFFKAPSAVKPAGTALLKATISAFDVNLNHILNDLSVGVASPSGPYSNQVYPA